MKINVKKLCLFVTMSTAAGLWTPEQVWAQDLELRKEAVGKAMQSMQQIPAGEQPAARQNSPFGGRDPFYYSNGPRNSPSRAGSGAIRKAAEAVRDAKGEDAKSAAQKKLADLLSKSYDEDMAQRERELKQIEERLTKLRDLLSRRRSKKQEIIDLQIKVALNEADGLGFYENERPAKSLVGNYYYAPVDPPRIENPPTPPTPPSLNASSFVPTANAPMGLPDAQPFADPAPSPSREPAPSKESDR